MGLIRFDVYPSSLLGDWPEVHAGYLTGADGRVFPTRIEILDNIIGCRRTSSESAKFHVAWPVEGFGIFGDEQVNIELLSARITVTQPREVALYARAFTELANLAVYGPAARALITSGITALDAG